MSMKGYDYTPKDYWYMAEQKLAHLPELAWNAADYEGKTPEERYALFNSWAERWHKQHNAYYATALITTFHEHREKHPRAVAISHGKNGGVRFASTVFDEVKAFPDPKEWEKTNPPAGSSWWSERREHDKRTAQGRALWENSIVIRRDLTLPPLELWGAWVASKEDELSDYLVERKTDNFENTKREARNWLNEDWIEEQTQKAIERLEIATLAWANIAKSKERVKVATMKVLEGVVE